MSDDEFSVLEHLMYGAAWIAAAATVLAGAIHLSGIRTLFLESGVWLLIEIVIGWAIVWGVVFTLAGVTQLLSRHLPIPPVVERGGSA